AIVLNKMPKELTENRKIIKLSKNKGTDPTSGIPSHRLITKYRDKTDAMVMTMELLMTLAMAISKALTGMTSKCSIVPRSFSRIMAAPTNSIASKDALDTICMGPANQV